MSDDPRAAHRDNIRGATLLMKANARTEKVEAELQRVMKERDDYKRLTNLGCKTVAEQDDAVMSMAKQRDLMAGQLMDVRETAKAAGITLPDFDPLPWMKRIVARAEAAEAKCAALVKALKAAETALIVHDPERTDAVLDMIRLAIAAARSGK